MVHDIRFEALAFGEAAIHELLELVVADDLQDTAPLD